MEKLSLNRAQLLVRNKYTVFTMGGTVALLSVNKKFSGELQFCSYPLSKLDHDDNFYKIFNIFKHIYVHVYVIQFEIKSYLSIL